MMTALTYLSYFATGLGSAGATAYFLGRNATVNVQIPLDTMEDMARQAREANAQKHNGPYL